MMTTEKVSSSHWVEDVFPPTFGYTARELYGRDNPVQGSELKTDPTKTQSSVYDMVARRISPLDATKIKNVYERVWLMNLLEEQEQKEREQKVTKTDKANNVPSAEERFLSKVTESGVKATQDDSNQLDIEDQTLWDSDEIDILRNVFKEAKRQNLHLKAMLRTNQEHLRKLERKYKRQSNVLEIKTDKLQDARKANERHQIASDNLKKQLNSANKTIDFLHEEIKHLREVQSELTKDNQSLKFELDKERIDRKNTQFDLINQQQAALREMELREEKLKLLHDDDIDYLQNQIEALTKELEKEKLDHQRSLKGLQHLRNHFSSVPLTADSSELNRKANVVDTDQLQKWTL